MDNSVVEKISPILANTLIVPSVSTGNVPQLAVDLLIHTLKLELVGRLSPRYLLPFAGPRDDIISNDNTEKNTGKNISPIKGITTPLEVYSNEKIAIIQQRSPTFPHCRDAFVNNTLIPFFYFGCDGNDSKSFKKLLIVSSSDAARRLDITGPLYEFYKIPLNYNINSFPLDINSTNDNKITKKNNNTINKNYEFKQNNLSSLSVPDKLPGSGFTLNIIKALSTNKNNYNFTHDNKNENENENENENRKEQELNIDLIVRYAFQGDNFGDAEDLASKILEYLKINKPNYPEAKNGWIRPSSWAGVYGESPKTALEDGIYS